MARVNLIDDASGSPIQAFPLVEGKINITTGTIADCMIACCVEDGAIALNGYSGTPSVTMVRDRA